MVKWRTVDCSGQSTRHENPRTRRYVLLFCRMTLLINLSATPRWSTFLVHLSLHGILMNLSLCLPVPVGSQGRLESKGRYHDLCTHSGKPIGGVRTFWSSVPRHLGGLKCINKFQSFKSLLNNTSLIHYLSWLFIRYPFYFFRFLNKRFIYFNYWIYTDYSVFSPYLMFIFSPAVSY